MVVYITGVLSSRSQSRVSICTYKENKPQNFVSNAQNFKYSHQNTISSGKEEYLSSTFTEGFLPYCSSSTWNKVHYYKFCFGIKYFVSTVPLES